MTDDEIIDKILRLAAELAARRKTQAWLGATETAHAAKTPVDWLAVVDWPPHPDLTDLGHPVWINMKKFADEANLSPRTAYERVQRRPIAVKIGGVWYVNRTRALTPTGSLPGEKG